MPRMPLQDRSGIKCVGVRWRKRWLRRHSQKDTLWRTGKKFDRWKAPIRRLNRLGMCHGSCSLGLRL